MIKNILFLVGLSFWTVNSSAAFVNLDFEDFIGTGSDLLPGWVVTSELVIPEVDFIPISTEAVGLVSASIPFLAAIEGQYSAALFAGTGVDFSQAIGVGISQAGLVPAGATHLSFVTSTLHPEDVAYSYTLGGIDLLQGTAEILDDSLTRYTVPIHSLAGQITTLDFSLIFTGGGGALPAIGHTLDSIQFVPIPPTLYLFGTGLLGLIGIARRRKAA